MADYLVQGHCRCAEDPVRFEFNKKPAEVHYCLCTDCTDVSGGAMAIIAVPERSAFRITSGEDKIRNIDTKPTAHRRFCADCGTHMSLYVDAFPDHVLVHVPTLDRNADIGVQPDRWVFTRSKHPMLNLPNDGLPRHEGWAPSGAAAAAA
jgi:hypothetical protein